MPLDLSPLRRAIATLEEALNAYERNGENPFIRDACIQRFERVYELTQKTIRRYLAVTEPTPINELGFPSLIRLAYERGLLNEEWVTWKVFGEARNLTSHTYDEATADEVFKRLPAFLAESKFLYDEVQRRQESER